MCGCLLFSFATSSVYIFNDIKDAERDRAHPIKRKRPIASGEVSVHDAATLGSILFVLAVAGNWCLERNTAAVSFLLLYILLNFLYSAGLKNYPIADIAILAGGFLIRVLYGGILAGIAVSQWLYLTVTFAAFYLVLGKRRNELIQRSDGSTREVLRYYSVDFLDKHMYLCMTVTIVFYALWAMETDNHILLLTVPIVLLICMRYNLKVEGTSDGDPVEVLLGDKALLAMCGGYGILILFAVYLL